MILYSESPGILGVALIMLITLTSSLAICKEKHQEFRENISGTLLEEEAMKVTNQDVMLSVVKKFYYCIDKNESDEISQIISENFVDHDAQEVGKGREELQNLITALHEGFEGISHDLEKIYFIDGDKVFVRWKMTGKHTGSFFNIPSSNKNILLYGHDLFRIVDGKIVEQWHVEQLLSLINQISSHK